MDRDIADFSVNYLTKKGASYAEARLEHHEGSGFILKNGNPEIAGFDKISGLGVRFLINNSLGFLSINDFTKKKIIELIDKSIKRTKASSRITDKIEFSASPAAKKSYKITQKIKSYPKK